MSWTRDEKMRSLSRMRAARVSVRMIALMLLVLCSMVRAIGNSPFRIEAAYVSPDSDYFRISGMVDVTRWLTARLSLIDVRLPPELGLSLLSPVTLYHPMDGPTLILSPWRRRWKVEPYIFAGLGLNVRKKTEQSAFEAVELTASYGLGAEAKLPFLKHGPSLFLEAGQSVLNVAFPSGHWSFHVGPNTRFVVGLRF